MRRCHIKTFNVLCEQCQGDFLCLIEKDRMSRRLAAKAVREEAGKHAYATYMAIEAVAEHFLAWRYVTSTICVHALSRRRSRARVLARRRQRECDPSLMHCRSSCCCWPRLPSQNWQENVQGRDYGDWYVCAAATSTPLTPTPTPLTPTTPYSYYSYYF